MSDNKKYELEIDISFESETVSVGTLADKIGLEPDKVVKQGVPPKLGAGSPKTNILFIKSGIQKINSSMTEQINGLKKRLVDYSRFSEFPSEIKIFVSCTTYGYEYIPDLSLLPEQISFISDMGAGFGVSVYDLTNA